MRLVQEHVAPGASTDDLTSANVIEDDKTMAMMGLTKTIEAVGAFIDHCRFVDFQLLIQNMVDYRRLSMRLRPLNPSLLKSSPTFRRSYFPS